MWETVRYGDIDYYEDRWALDALIAAVPSEMQFSLSKKRTAKEAWDAIAAARIGSDRACKTTLQALRKEWENLAFKPGEDVDDFALRLDTLQQRGGHVLSAHQGGGEPLRLMPLEIIRYLHMPGAELTPPPLPMRRGPGHIVAVDTPWPNSQACHSCGRRRLMPASGCRWRSRGRLRGCYPRHVLAPRLGRLYASCAACRACGRPLREGTPPSSHRSGRPPNVPE
jgi:hypothetical protein